VRDKLYPGDRIETGEGAQVVLVMFNAKATLDVMGTASLGILESGVDLSNGRIELAIFTELLKGNEFYSLRGRDAVAQFRDSASMEVETVPGAGTLPEHTVTTICALSGSVRVDPRGGNTINLDSGECAKISAAAPRVERTRLAPPSAGAPKALPKRHP
jgi:hypothetical protein